jgi:hypothetical protein
MKVSWDEEIQNIWKNKIHVPNHQPVQYLFNYKWNCNSETPESFRELQYWGSTIYDSMSPEFYG